MNIAWAKFSPCRAYRYELFRKVSGNGDRTLVVVMLNPSTADETKDDPTIRRVIGFARSWGFYAVKVLNLFAIRATDPKEMLAASDPIGPENDKWLADALESAKAAGVPVLAAWGAHGGHRGRDFHVMHKLVDGVDWQYLGRTHAGHPKHPLYIPKNMTMQPIERRAAK